MTASLQPAYFEDLYARNGDPWRFATSDYERAKYDATLAALPAVRYRCAFEVGCSIGVLTERLAARCDRLLSVDVSPTALAQARNRVGHLPHITLDQMQIPAAWPDRRFDLILLSEVLYYLSAEDLAHTAQRVVESLLPGGVVLLVHYTLPTNYPATGDQAAEDFMRLTEMAPIRQLREAQYRLDLLQG